MVRVKTSPRQVEEAKMDNKEAIEKIARKLQRKFSYNRLEYSRNPDKSMCFDDMASEALYQVEMLGYRLPPAEEELLEHEIKHIEIALKEHYKDEWCSVCDNIARKLGFNS